MVHRAPSNDYIVAPGSTLGSLEAKRERFRLGAALGCFSLAYMLFISWQDPALPWPATFDSVGPWLTAALNVIPVLLLNFLLIILTRRVVVSAWLTLLVLALLYVVNRLKLQALATPLLPDDFHFLRTLGVSYSFFSNYMLNSRAQLVIAAVVLAVTLVLFREPALRTLRGMKRAMAAVAVIALATSLVHGLSPWTKLYDPGRLQFEPWAPYESAARTGVIANMLLFHWELSRDRAIPPDLAEAKRLVRGSLPPLSIRNIGAAEEPYPDIIILQSESLFDPARLTGGPPNALLRFRSAAAVGATGELFVPAFAGGTIRTEFEVFTGLPLAAFPQVRFPYLQLTQPKLPGLVRVLAERGYRTVAIHPNGGAFWNRNQAFGSMGFERFIDGRGFADAALFGHYVSDGALGDRIMAELADDGAPQLIAAITIQNHGPYTPRGMLDVSAVNDLVPAEMEGEAREALLTYLAMLRASDEQLGRLVEFVQRRERRTLLLFYSDHLPPLHETFARAPFVDGRPPMQQPVPWLLLDNRSQQARVQNLSSWQLPAVLLDQAGVPKDSYFEALEYLASQADALDEMFNPNAVIRALAQLQYWQQLGDVLEQVID